MQESLWVLLSIALGFLGGYFNVLIKDEGFVDPYKYEDKDGRTRRFPGSWRELMLGSGAGLVSCAIAIATSKPTIWTIILYAILAGISGGSYLERMVEKNVTSKINQLNQELDKLEQEDIKKGEN
jgi:uncharacterized membrane protein